MTLATLEPRARRGRSCEFPLCDRPHRANGWCNAHNEQSRLGKELTPLLSLPKYANTYLAYWPDALDVGVGVLKVGRAWKWSRIASLQRSGAQILILAHGTDATWEREALKQLTRVFDPAFTCAEDSAGVLWRGRGWTECFRVEERDIRIAYRLTIRGFAYGNETGANPDDGIRPKFTRAQWLRYKKRQVATHIAALADSCGDARETTPHEPERDAAPRRVADSGDSRSRCAGVRSRPGGDTPARLGGVRFSFDDQGRPLLVDRSLASSRAASAPWWPEILHGYWERGKRRGERRESATTSARTTTPRRRTGHSALDFGGRRTDHAAQASSCVGCSAHRLPGSPQRLSDWSLWTMWHATRTPRRVPRTRTVSGAAGALREGAGVR